MEEINSIVQNNVEDAKNANEITQKAQQSVVDSRTELLDAVNNSIETNQEMLQNLQKTNTSVVEAMEEIMESSKKIEGITTLMNDIAFQTNLLALNASVEGQHVLASTEKVSLLWRPKYVNLLTVRPKPLRRLES